MSLGHAIGIPFRRGGGFDWAAYWATRLDTWHNSIDDDDFIDSINSLNAKILPICNYLNGSDDYASLSVDNYLISSNTGKITAYVKVITGESIIFFSSAKSSLPNDYIQFSIANNLLYIKIRGGTSSPAVSNTWVRSTIAMTEGWHEVEVSSNGSVYAMKVDGVTQTLAVSVGLNAGKWFDDINSGRNNIAIGSLRTSEPTYGNGAVAWVKMDDGVNGHWICDNNKYVYDVSGNGYHMTFAGTGKRIVGDSGAANYKLTNGFTTYGKQNSISIQVPRLSAGTKIISPTLPAGYIEIQDVAGGADNGCDYIIDFDPDDTADSKLDVFDKSNATIHIATASMNYYNSIEIYQWLITELYDPRIYFAYFNIGYRGRIFSKITSKLVSGLYYPIGYSEQLNCILDQTLADEWKAFDYCGLRVFALTDAEGNPIYDGNDYVVID